MVSNLLYVEVAFMSVGLNTNFKTRNGCLSGPRLITRQLYSHCWCTVHVYTQLSAQHSQKLSRNIGVSNNIAVGNYPAEPYSCLQV